MALRACRKLMKALAATNEDSESSDDSDADEIEDDENDDDKNVTMADEDQVMMHIMDSLVLLAAMQRKEQADAPTNNADARMARNKVFMAATTILGLSLLGIDCKEHPNQSKNAAIDQLVKAFPLRDDAYAVKNNRKGWLPLHWAVALAPVGQYNVTKADVETLYALDPTAMQTKHVDGATSDGEEDEHENENEDDSEDETVGLNPAHLLCMSPVTPCSMQLIRTLSVCSPTAFASATTVSALHVACRYGTPTVELLQHLLQIDSSQAKVKVSFIGDDDEHCPLVQLCFNLMESADELSNAEDLVSCLLDMNKSEEVVGNALFGCLEAFALLKSRNGAVIDGASSRVYGMVEMLLKANPEAANHRDSRNDTLLHLMCLNSLPSKLCIDIMKLVLALHKDAVQERSSLGWLPVHCAAEFCDLEVLEFLLGLNPESATSLTSEGSNLLVFAVDDADISSATRKVPYLCSRYPEMVLQRSKWGDIPIHFAVFSANFKILPALYEAGGIEQFKTPIAHPTNATYPHNGYLPLHLFIRKQFPNDNDGRMPLPLSEEADMLRWLLHLYPEAAGIEGGVGAGNKKTPYQLAVDRKLPDYYRRLLLRAAPTLNPAELHRLNYAERRMAMFLAFKALSSTLKAPLFARLRGESKDLVRRVVSFL
jgi:ankyrin repeat protein